MSMAHSTKANPKIRRSSFNLNESDSSANDHQDEAMNSLSEEEVLDNSALEFFKKRKNKNTTSPYNKLSQTNSKKQAKRVRTNKFKDVSGKDNNDDSSSDYNDHQNQSSYKMREEIMRFSKVS